MPFTFRPLTVTRQGSELELRGRLLTGAYFGPQAAIVRSTSGQERATHIHSHGMECRVPGPGLDRGAFRIAEGPLGSHSGHSSLPASRGLAIPSWGGSTTASTASEIRGAG